MSIWTEMQDRGTGDIVKKEDDILKIEDCLDSTSTYVINSDNSIDVEGNVLIKDIKFPAGELPFIFRKVTGDFRCVRTNLESLVGFPIVVLGDLDISDNKLTSLEGCPTEIFEDFCCSNNQLTSLEGGPSFVMGNYLCFSNCLESLKGCSRSVWGKLDCHSNKLVSLQGAPSEVGCGSGSGRSFDCSKNLLETLDGCPQRVQGGFRCHSNKVVFTEEDVRARCAVGGKIKTK